MVLNSFTPSKSFQMATKYAIIFYPVEILERPPPSAKHFYAISHALKAPMVELQQLQ